MTNNLPQLDRKRVGRDIFISYSRRDKLFVQRLYAALKAHDREVWVDWEDIPPYAYWREEIRTGILAADAFLFIITPESVASIECNKELNFAIEQNKRLLPIIHRDINRETHAKIQAEIAEINWFPFRESDDPKTDDFDSAFQALLRAIDTDLEYVQLHTRVAMRADEWLKHDRDNSFLLRGSALETAEKWLAQSVDKKPQPTDVHRQYIGISRLLETARQKVQARRRIAMYALGSIALVLTSVFAVIAEVRRRQAVEREITALVSSSDARFVLDQKLEALLQSLRAGTQLQQADWVNRNPALTTDVMKVLTQATFWVQEQNRLQANSGFVGGFSFSPDGQTIASTHGDGTLKLWQRDGRSIATLQGHTDGVISVMFSPDGQRLASGGLDSTVRLWRSDGMPLTTLQTSGAVRSVRFSPDGQRVAAGGDDNQLRLWDLSGKLVATFNGHRDRVNSVRFSPDGKTIASASDDKTIKLWRQDGKLIATLRGHQAQVIGLSFSPDGRVLASGSLDKTIRLWRDRKPINIIRGLSDGVRALSFSPDGKLLASGGEDFAVKLWQSDGSLITTLTGHRNAIADLNFSPDSQVLGSASLDGTIKLWRSKTPRLTVLVDRTNPKANDFDHIPNSVRFNPDGQLLAVGNMNGTVNLWKPDGSLVKTLSQHRDRVNAVNFSPNGQLLASASGDGTVNLWRNGDRIGTLKGQDRLLDVSFSPDGTTVSGAMPKGLIATADAEGMVKLWRQNGSLIRSLKGHSGFVYNVSFSPDGQKLVSAGADGTVRLWKLDGSPIATLKEPKDKAYTVYQVSFSPDGQRIAAASADGTVKLWTIDGTFIASFGDRTAQMTAVRFHPYKPIIAVADDNGTIFLWQFDGTLLTTLTGHQKGVWSLSFSPDGKTLASASDDTRVVLWNLDELSLDRMLRLGCDWIHDYLKTNPTVTVDDRSLCDRFRTQP